MAVPSGWPAGLAEGPAGRVAQPPSPARALLPSGLQPAEPAVELPVVPAVHAAVPVEVEVPQVPGLGGGRPERGPEPVAVKSVHVPVAVRVAEQPDEALHPVASR